MDGDKHDNCWRPYADIVQQIIQAQAELKYETGIPLILVFGISLGLKRFVILP